MRSARFISCSALVLAVSILAGCGAGNHAGVTPGVLGDSTDTGRLSVGATALPSPTPTPNSRLTKGTGNGQINGDDTMFPGGIGEDKNDGDYSNGGHGPVGDTKGPDGVPCKASMNTNGIPPKGTGYHVHAFLGIYYNGTEAALPDGLGFADPSGDGQFPGTPPNWTQYASVCYYEMHTHDASGTIHMESITPPTGFQNGTKYTLGDFLAIWGIPVSPVNFGPLNGPVTVYTSGQFSRGHQCTPHCYVTSNTYTMYAGDPSTIPLYSHEVVWVLVGAGNPTGSSLPNVLFFDEW